MATYDLSEAELNTNLTPTFDAATRDAIIDYLTARGAFTGDSSVQVHTDPFPTDPTDPSVELESISAPNSPVTGAPNLKAVITNDNENHQLHIEGTGDLLIATGGGDDLIFIGPKVADGGPANGTGGYVVYAGGGSDTIIGGSGDLRAFGQDGDDFLQVGVGSSTLFGGEGADTFWDDNAVGNRMDGEAGNDTFHLLGSGADVVNAGDGNDTIYATSSTGDNTLNGGDGDDTIYGGIGSSTLRGGEGDNLLVSNSGVGEGSRLIAQGSGSNTLQGGAGSDTLAGGTATGDNTFVAMTGATTMIGGSGDDSFGVSASEDGVDNNGDLTINGGGGTDTVFFYNFEVADAGIVTVGATTTITFATEGLTVTVTNIETLNFTNGNVVL